VLQDCSAADASPAYAATLRHKNRPFGHQRRFRERPIIPKKSPSNVPLFPAQNSHRYARAIDASLPRPSGALRVNGDCGKWHLCLKGNATRTTLREAVAYENATEVLFQSFHAAVNITPTTRCFLASFGQRVHSLQWRIQRVSRVSRHPPFCLSALLEKNIF